MKNLSFLFSLLLTFTLLGCQEEDREKRTGDQSFKLSYMIPASTQVVSRSAISTEDGEDQVNSFYILFFEHTTGGIGKFIAAIDVMETHEGPLSNSGILDIEFPAGSGLNATETYNMLLCANIEEYQTGITNLSGLEAVCQDKTEREVIGMLQAKIEGVPAGLSPREEQEFNDRRMVITNLPMSTSAVKQAGQDELTVELIRTVSRFDVALDQTTVEGYRLESASIWNAYTVCRIWEGVFSEFTDARTERYYGVKANGNKEITASLYAFENYVSTPAQTDKSTTCLIIGLNNLSTGKTEYFRANVNASGSLGHQLHRNHIYTLIIKSVNNQGDENERGAYDNTDDMRLSFDINGWKVDDSGTLQIEGPDVLASPTATVRLFAQGETRQYYVYTIGEGVPAITGKNLPGHIKATLTLAPGYSESSNFKTSILTFEAAPGKTNNNNYKIEIGFSFMSALITVEQVEGNSEYIDLAPYKEVIGLGEKAGSVTEEITVNSSGTWVAEIIQGDHLSFTSGSRQTKIEGASGQAFSLYAFELNAADEPRYWFVSVYLKDHPEIIRNLVIRQQGGADPRYVRFPQQEMKIATGGGSTNAFTIESNDVWTAEIIIEEGTQAGFNSTYTVTKIPETSKNKTNNRVYLPAHYGNVPTRVIVRAQVKDSENYAEMFISQDPYYTGSLFVSNAAGISNLVASTNTNYTYYVYNLGENMRNTSLFGPGATWVDMPDGGFDFKTSTDINVMNEARIMQFVSSPTTAIFNNAYAKYKEDPSKLWIFSNSSYSITNSLLNSFRGKESTGYAASSIVSVSNSGINYREFFQGDHTEHPLIQYLLNGLAGPVNPDEIQLQGYSSAGGIREGNWPSTFVPIIKSVVGQNTYCVFGIDPVH
ncbi:MAG: hypothetical protein LUD74_04050, partial [Tannerellaceae bacterium]|nr:hypothetical protein [Tannerellaceae bacterium]